MKKLVLVRVDGDDVQKVQAFDKDMSDSEAIKISREYAHDHKDHCYSLLRLTEVEDGKFALYPQEVIDCWNYDLPEIDMEEVERRAEEIEKKLFPGAQ